MCNKKTDSQNSQLYVGACGLFIILAIIIIQLTFDHQKKFQTLQSTAYGIIETINGKPFEDIKTGEDAIKQIEVYQSLEYPLDKQIEITTDCSINWIIQIPTPLIFYIENDNGIAKVIDVKHHGITILSDYETYQKEYSFDVSNLINRINTEKFDSLEQIFNTENSGMGYDFDYDVKVYQSLDYPSDKQIKVTGSWSKKTVILFIENHDGLAKVVDMKEQK